MINNPELGKTHVTRIGQSQPVGLLVEQDGPWFKVRWGVQDRRAYEEMVLTYDLEEVEYVIHQPEAIQIRQDLERGGHIVEET